ncbi:hypothetical protein BKG91_03395 [Rodentibacter caecimuris]|uniref:hypothetical protein n=1 Tax=Rodentibacter caecimuris TaxID=1796644 RepID=UPI00075175C0|nr:hypothetical protein [Rodentibacter heylii]AOF53711.1 hypothetical protein AC062_1619 [Pasteurellaceae bacterium NI1060]OOF75503.1 hypothetical protein BKG91_03395 [Rodentibacter heylii]
MKRIKITHRGCYGVLNGQFQALPIGSEMTVAEMPAAFVGRAVVLNETDGELEIPKENSRTKPKPQKDK